MGALNSVPFVFASLISINLLSTPTFVRGQETIDQARPAATPAQKSEAQRLYEAGKIAYFNGDYAAGIENYRQAFLKNPDRPLAYYNSLAWCWATCPDEKQRDGRLAAKIGRYMCQETNYNDPFYLDTYAAALAESGDFEAAVQWQQKAVELAAASETFPKNELSSCRLRLELFKQRRPYREVPQSAILEQYKMIVGNEVSQASLRQIGDGQKARLKSYLLSVPEREYMQASDSLVHDLWDMVLLALTSDSMDHAERKDWTRRITDMTESQRQRFRDICLTERHNLDAADNEYEHAIAALHERASSAHSAPRPTPEHEQERTVFKPALPEIKIEPKITVSTAPPKAAVDIVLHSVTIHSTRDGTKPWDESGPADLRVVIENLNTGATYSSPLKRDTESAEFHCKTIRVAEGETFRMSVMDGDVAFDDTVGSYDKEVTADTMKLGTVNWTFDRVASIVLEFQP